MDQGQEPKTTKLRARPGVVANPTDEDPIKV